MDLKLKGKKVLITGASRGIGASIAYNFLQEGADVVIVSRGSPALFETEKRLQAKFGMDRVIAEKCDCTNEKELICLRNKILDSMNSLDILINNIGDGQSTSEVISNTDQWEKIWDINFNSGLRTTRTFLPLLIKSDGCLLFISSIAGLEAFGAPIDYSTAKSAINFLAKNLARKLAGKVRVNNIAPGNIYFEGGSWDKKIQNDKKNTLKIIKETVPMNRFGKPDEIADSAVFLCSERAKFITGATLVVDGGQTLGI